VACDFVFACNLSSSSSFLSGAGHVGGGNAGHPRNIPPMARSALMMLVAGGGRARFPAAHATQKAKLETGEAAFCFMSRNKLTCICLVRSSIFPAR